MPKITSVEPQKKNPKRFNVFLEGIFAFGADEDLIVEHRLIVGKEVDQQYLEKLLFEAEVGKLMERMYALFNIRQRSEREVRNYLKNLSFKRKVKGQDDISEAAVELLIAKLKQKRLLSDEEFAKAWVDSRRKTKKKGRIVLKLELYQKGIDKEIIDKILQNFSTKDERELAEKALEKKLKIWKDLPPLEFKRKAFIFLQRYGFEYDVVQSVVDNFLKKS